MKAESAIIICVSVCIFLTFYFSYLSLQTFDDSFKRQFILLAVSSLLIGATIFGCLVIYIGLKRIFVKAELSGAQETREGESQGS